MSDIENQPYLPVGPVQAAGTSFSWWGLLGAILVFGVIMFVSLLIIRSLKKSSLGMGNSRWLRVLDRQFLGGQHVLYLVEVAGKLQVLGGTERGLVKIAEVDDMGLAAEILEEIANRPLESAVGLIPSLLGRFSRRSGKKSFGHELEHLLGGVKDENLN